MSKDQFHDVIVIGAGVAGICQIKHLIDHGFDAILLEANDDLGGTWYHNRYPGCRFDSESYTYGYRFSQEVLDEWHWKEHFSAQPDNLAYLNYVAEKFDLRRHMRFNAMVEAMRWEEGARAWSVALQDGTELKARFVITCLGVLSVPTLPQLEGMADFSGQAFHSRDWPHEPVALAGRRVGVIGTGATGIQIIAEIADKVEALYVFQRRANWSVPLNNAPINEAEMAEIRARYDEIFDICNKSQGGFCHLPDRRGYENVTAAERRAFWDELYNLRGFSLLVGNFPETFLEAAANRELSDYVAERIRARVADRAIAEKLIPKDHGFGMKRLPLETDYFEAYNRDNVHLIDLQDTPIERVTRRGIKTSHAEIDLDMIVYATGYDAVLGGFNQIDIHGVGGRLLRDKWRDETTTHLGLLTHGFPNMLMIAGPQSVSGSTNYPPSIEKGVDWVTRLLVQTRKAGHTRIETTQEAEHWWTEEVIRMQERMPFSDVKSWFTGYSPNARSGGTPKIRYNAFWGGAPAYNAALDREAEENYPQIALA